MLMLLQQKTVASIVGLRQMRCAMLVVSKLHCGVNLLQHILSEATEFVVKQKDGSTSLNLTWRTLIGFECLQCVLCNSSLT